MIIKSILKAINSIPFIKRNTKKILKAITRIPYVNRWLSRIATNFACNTTKPRPKAFSLWSHIEKPMPSGKQDLGDYTKQGPVGDYTAWPMLIDRTFSARHLSPASQEYVDQLPVDKPPKGIPPNLNKDTVGDVTALFARKGDMIEGRSSILFMFFAQWFTDSILRIDPADRRKNTSNHNIDLCQIYGLTEDTATVLRSKKLGKLKSQKIKGDEYLDYLGEVGSDGEWEVKDEYKKLPYAEEKVIEKLFGLWDRIDKTRRYKLYATGLERGNSSIGYVAISTLFMREHNRICSELFKINPSWDDERLFQTARMINIIILMKLVVQDYINHISGIDLFHFDHTFAEKQDWYRTPRIALEFDLLYRWHGLIPDVIKVGNTEYKHTEYRVNNALLEKVGIGKIIDTVSQQRAGKIPLSNVPNFLLSAEYATIKMGRDFRLSPYNDYRELFGLDALTSFDQLTDEKELRDTLEKLYGDIGNVEYIVGLFAEKPEEGSLYGELMGRMVAHDAFTQIYTNPLLSKNVYNEKTLSLYGVELIEATNSVQDLVDRNTSSDTKIKAGFSL